MNERLLNAKEVSDLLSINVMTIYKMSRAGKLPSCKIGKLRRFRESDMRLFIKQLTDKKKEVAK